MSRNPRKSFVGPPDAILFLSILREGVFQQPQTLTLTTGRKWSGFRSDQGQTGSNLAVVSHLCFTPVVAQFTAFDGVIIGASMSSCAARRLLSPLRCFAAIGRCLSRPRFG